MITVRLRVSFALAMTGSSVGGGQVTDVEPVAPDAAVDGPPVLDGSFDGDAFVGVGRVPRADCTRSEYEDPCRPEGGMDADLDGAAPDASD